MFLDKQKAGAQADYIQRINNHVSTYVNGKVYKQFDRSGIDYQATAGVKVTW